jgi:hypothetical protein
VSGEDMIYACCGTNAAFLVERFNPFRGEWHRLTPTNTARRAHACCLLPPATEWDIETRTDSLVHSFYGQPSQSEQSFQICADRFTQARDYSAGLLLWGGYGQVRPLDSVVRMQFGLDELPPQWTLTEAERKSLTTPPDAQPFSDEAGFVIAPPESTPLRRCRLGHWFAAETIKQLSAAPQQIGVALAPAEWRPLSLREECKAATDFGGSVSAGAGAGVGAGATGASACSVKHKRVHGTMYVVSGRSLLRFQRGRAPMPALSAIAAAKGEVVDPLGEWIVEPLALLPVDIAVRPSVIMA